MSDDVDASADLLDRLPGDAAVVRRGGFAQLLDQGEAVSVERLARDCGMGMAQTVAALAALVGTGTATRNAGGALVAVGGLSVVPAAHQLILGDRQFFTWCAFDAVGIPAALGLDGVARTTCGHCGVPLEVAIVAGEPADTDGDRVGWLPGGPCANVQADFCPAANLFCSRAHLDAWRDEAGGPPGRSASLTDLAGEGRKVWAEMRPAPPGEGVPSD